MNDNYKYGMMEGHNLDDYLEKEDPDYFDEYLMEHEE